ncbi:hypothetical protein DENSPDRAFT_617039 [Dentipellis sp. KUC8613]|nr:hypothetical protein DENSPDRAFT_617039 [Dentipellis sp. KUC8613]
MPRSTSHEYDRRVVSMPMARSQAASHRHMNPTSAESSRRSISSRQPARRFPQPAEQNDPFLLDEAGRPVVRRPGYIFAQQVDHYASEASDLYQGEHPKNKTRPLRALPSRARAPQVPPSAFEDPEPWIPGPNINPLGFSAPAELRRNRHYRALLKSYEEVVARVHRSEALADKYASQLIQLLQQRLSDASVGGQPHLLNRDYVSGPPSEITPDDSVSVGPQGNTFETLRNHPALRPEEYRKAILWTPEDWSSDPMSKDGPPRLLMYTFIRNTQGDIVEDAWPHVMEAAEQARSMLVNLPEPVNELAHTDGPRLLPWYQKWYPKEFDSAITWMETQQPLLSLCAAHWKAICVLESVIQDYCYDSEPVFSMSSSDFSNDGDDNEDNNEDDIDNDNDNEGEDSQPGRRKHARSPSGSNVPSKRGKFTAGLPKTTNCDDTKSAGMTGENDVQMQGLDRSELTVLTVPELQSLLTDQPLRKRKKKEELITLITSLPPSEQPSSETIQDLLGQRRTKTSARRHVK